MGWGHSSVSDAIAFARRAEVERLVLFHHDPLHDDAMLDELGEHARAAWSDDGRDAVTALMAAEGDSIEV